MQYSTRSGIVRSRMKAGPLPNIVDHVVHDQPSTCHQDQGMMNQDQRQSIPRQREPPSGLTPTSSQQLYNQEENISKEKDSALKRKRGPRRMDEIWALPEGKFIKITFNDKGQPVGDSAKKLIGYLGVLARKGMEAPLDYNDWRAVPTDNKDLLWNILMSKFDGIEDYKEWIMKSLGKKWKDYKCMLKRKFYEIYKTDEERIANCPETVIPEQWEKLVYFWSSPEGQQRSSTNKFNRSKLVTTHTAGTKSFARVNHDESTNRGGKELSRAEIFVLTHTKKNKEPMNKASSDHIKRIRELQSKLSEDNEDSLGPEDIFSQVFGKEKHGCIRGLGLGPIPSELFGPKHTHQTCLRMTREARIEADKKVDMLNEKIHNMEEKYRKMMEIFGTEENYEKVMAMFTSMQQTKTSEPLHNDAPIAQSDHLKDRQNYENECSPEENSQQEIESSSSSHLVPPRQVLKVNRRTIKNVTSAQERAEVILKSPFRPYHSVAQGTLISKDPTTQVGGEKLGNQFWEIYIEIAMVPSEKLIRSYGKFKTIGDAVLQTIAWPSTFVEYIRT
uniref:Transposase Tnp1/En/Spm-like domain-containing protein n=1 Tax=Ananas comosus var. bracteatus TaxID=296719 RepID=A0A6V7NH66_ANACO|nr:unnamed protein product [Ananas comosus var. bracteatus]